MSNWVLDNYLRETPLKKANLFLSLIALVGLLACTSVTVEPEVAATAVPPAPATPIKLATAVSVATLTIDNSQLTIDNSPTPSPTPTLIPTDAPSTKIPRATPTIGVPESPQTYTVAANGLQFVMDTRLATAVYPDHSREDLRYRRFQFALEGFCRNVGCVTVYEVDSFRAEIPGGEFIMDDLVAALENGSETHIPTWGAAIMLQTQESTLAFGSGTGLRAVVMRGQTAFWANNDEIVYDYHGLTEDGRYYVNITIPIDAPILIDSFDPANNTNPNALPVPEPAADPVEEIIQMGEYNALAEKQLGDLSEAAYTPDLTLLDALVASLIVGDE